MKRRLAIVVIVGIALITALALYLSFPSSPHGVKVNVRNVGTKPMRNVFVVVTGASYTIGDVEPNSQRSVRVNPKGESHVVLRCNDAHGVFQSLNAGGYFEPGYGGEMTIDVADGAIIKVDNQVRIR